MVAGNVAAIVQSNVKRLLAYSAIAHAGYALLALLGDGRHALPALLYYTITYAFTVLGAFAVVTVIEESGGRGKLSDFAGLGRRAPVLSFCMLVFMLSLAGIPPLSGFFGKFYVFTAAAAAAPPLSLLWLVVLAVAASAVSLYYYLQVLKQIYAVAPSPTAAWPRPAFSAQAAIVVLAGDCHCVRLRSRFASGQDFRPAQIPSFLRRRRGCWEEREAGRPHRSLH